ncbi:MAG: hypothetical protein IH624_10310 [Phycisphaerae bacterium]|nr:hypothetical protein [Phycisphaerae bacterium]
MNIAELLKKSAPQLSWAVYAAAAILAAATVTRVFAHVASAEQLGATLEQYKAQGKNNEEKVKDLLAKGRQTGDQLKKKNIFVPPPPKPNPPTCQGIIGSSALFGDKLYKAGEKVGAAEVVSVGTTEVVIKWEDREMTLVPFDGDSRSSGGPSRAASSDRPAGGMPRPDGSATRPPAPQGGASTTQVRPAGPEGGVRAAMGNMSDEERQQLVDRFRNMSPEERDRFREEQRQRFGERGGPGGNPRGGRGR